MVAQSSSSSPLPTVPVQAWKNWLIGGALGLLLLFVLRAVLLPDPTATMFFRAQRLESQGRLESALRHYALITDLHPESSYAPDALNHQGDILTSLAQHAHRGQDFKLYTQAIAAYMRLADRYPASPLAGDALLAAGALANNNLHDTKTATTAYQHLLERFPNNTEYVSEATLRLGCLAIQEGDKQKAQTLLQNVLQHYNNYPDRCAEAQYNLGVTYETLFRNKPWAKRAYLATCTQYPQSKWAGAARISLGMIVYHEAAPILRRVLIQVAPLPDTGIVDGSLFAALRPLLAAHKLEVSDISLRGWSLTPFYAGYAPDDPSRVVAPPFDGFDNAVANVGLRYTKFNGKDDVTALKTLQSELDAAHTPIIYDGQWALAVGYDTARNEVFAQSHGAQFETLPKKDFSVAWKQVSPLGGAYTMLAFYLPDEHPTFVSPQPTPVSIGQAQPTPAAGRVSALGGGKAGALATSATPEPVSLTTPTFVYASKPLAAVTAHRRALRQAVALMQRPQEQAGGPLLNLEALNALAQELTRLAIRPTTPAPQPEPATSLPTPDATATPETARASATLLPPTPVAPAPTAAAPTAPQDVPGRARALLGWFQAPLQHWISTRRDAAAYLDAAANALHDGSLRGAATGFRNSISALQNAAATLPAADALSSDGKNLSEDARRRFESAGHQLAAAQLAESRAVDAMRRAAR